MTSPMRAELVCNLLRLTPWRRQLPDGVILPNGRRAQDCSNEFQHLLRDLNLFSSTSARGDCFDNGAAEGFVHSLKVKAMHGERIATRTGTRETVVACVESDANRNRRPSANGYLHPDASEATTVA